MRPPRGSLVLIRVPFVQTGGSKIRPAMVVFDCGDADFVAASITSQKAGSACDVELNDWLSAGLNVASTVRLDKVAVLGWSDVIKSLGRVSDRDSTRCGEVLCHIYCVQS
jgi:mRNA-degrading endonuclease toxin of MazEF toxin-antitoxin module